MPRRLVRIVRREQTTCTILLLEYNLHYNIILIFASSLHFCVKKSQLNLRALARKGETSGSSEERRRACVTCSRTRAWRIAVGVCGCRHSCFEVLLAIRAVFLHPTRKKRRICPLVHPRLFPLQYNVESLEFSKERAGKRQNTKKSYPTKKS